MVVGHFSISGLGDPSVVNRYHCNVSLLSSTLEKAVMNKDRSSPSPPHVDPSISFLFHLSDLVTSLSRSGQAELGNEEITYRN